MTHRMHLMIKASRGVEGEDQKQAYKTVALVKCETPGRLKALSARLSAVV